MGDPGYSTEYTEDQVTKQNSMRVGDSAAFENSSRDAGGQILSEGEITMEEMLQQSTVVDTEEEDEPDRYEFTGDGVALGSIGHTLVAKPDYDLS